jgi:hypothetical protein
MTMDDLFGDDVGNKGGDEDVGATLLEPEDVVTPGFRGTKTRARTSSPDVLGPSLTHMMNHGTESNVTTLLYNRNSIQNK